MRPINYNFAPSGADIDAFSAGVTAKIWTITNPSPTGDIAHQISLTNNSLTNYSANTVTFTGISIYGSSFSETINMPGPSATVSTTQYFKILTSAVPSVTIGTDTMDIGVLAAFLLPIVPLDWRGGIVGVNVTVTGTINYSLQQTLNLIQETNLNNINWLDNDDPSLVNSVISKNGNYASIPQAIRLVINSFTPGATIQFNITQSDNH